MRRIFLPLAITVGLALASTGCRGPAAPIAFVGGMLVGHALAHGEEDDHLHHRDRDVPTIVVVGTPATTVVYAAPEGGSSRDRVATEARGPAFDGVAARDAFAKVDVSSCGAPRGYGHAKVSFNPTGDATKVVVDEPSGLSRETATCIGDRLGAVTVPPFAGSYVTVGTTFLVR